MRFLIYLFLVFGASNCGSSSSTGENALVSASDSSRNQEQRNDILVGDISKADLMQEPHAAWFEAMYKSYEPKQSALETVKSNINEYEITVFMGTWCGDSKREIPKLYKLLEMSDFDMDNLEMKAVELDKTLPNDLQEDFDVHHVPTIIFYKDGEEVERFVEYPQQRFEEDIAKIVSGEEYKDPYE